MKLVWKLLKQNLSKGQLIGFGVANFIGITIVLLALQFYFDVSPMFTQKDNLLKRDFFVITKKVGVMGALGQETSGFSPAEIGEIQAQSFVKEVGAFSSSQFAVFGGVSGELTGQTFRTEMFFESVPDNFIDVQSKAWKFSPQDDAVPIIIPKNYLDLYNFGFAEARRMPKISEGLATMVGMDIVIMGGGRSLPLKGKIVGFSSRINTILVPQSFMEWANKHYGEGAAKQPARLMLEVGNIADPNIATFFKERGYEVEGENQAVGRMAFFMRLFVGIVAGVGILICLLSIAILVLSIYLLIEKNMQKLQNLRLLGYSARAVTRRYEWLSVGINLLVHCGALGCVVFLRSYYLSHLQQVWSGLESSSLWAVAGIACLMFIAVTALNIIVIRKKVK